MPGATFEPLLRPTMQTPCRLRFRERRRNYIQELADCTRFGNSKSVGHGKCIMEAWIRSDGPKRLQSGQDAVKMPWCTWPEDLQPCLSVPRMVQTTTNHTSNVEGCKNVSVAHGVKCASFAGHRKSRRSAGARGFGLRCLQKHGRIQVTKTMVALAAITALAGGGIGAAVARRGNPDDPRERSEIQTSGCRDRQCSSGAEGMGLGRGQGMGQGRGQGMGYGRGQGMGAGGGRGMGLGRGQGMGLGPNTIDSAGDGQEEACGHRNTNESGDERGRGCGHGGAGRGLGRGCGQQVAMGSGRGRGRGQGCEGGSCVQDLVSAEKAPTAGRAKPWGRTSNPQTAAQLTSEFHLTMAELIEAEAEDVPDEAKIKQLAEEVEKLREKLGPMEGPGDGHGAGRGQGCGDGHGQG